MWDPVYDGSLVDAIEFKLRLQNLSTHFFVKENHVRGEVDGGDAEGAGRREGETERGSR